MQTRTLCLSHTHPLSLSHSHTHTISLSLSLSHSPLQLQGLRWLKRHAELQCRSSSRRHHLLYYKEKGFLAKIVSAIQAGDIIILENIGELVTSYLLCSSHWPSLCLVRVDRANSRGRPATPSPVAGRAR